MHMDCCKFTTFTLKLAVITSWKPPPFLSLEIEKFEGHVYLDTRLDLEFLNMKLKVRKILYFKCISNASSKLIFFTLSLDTYWVSRKYIVKKGCGIVCQTTQLFFQLIKFSSNIILNQSNLLKKSYPTLWNKLVGQMLSLVRGICHLILLFSVKRYSVKCNK